MTNIFNVYKYLNEEDGKNLKKDAIGIKPATFNRYLTLFRKAGFKIIKLKSIHKIINYSDSVKFSDAEIGLIAYLKLLSDKFFPKVKNKVFTRLIEKLLQLTNKETEIEAEEKFSKMKQLSDMNLFREKLETFEKYQNDNLNVLVLLKNGKELILQPKETIFKNRKIYLSFMDNKTQELHQIDINKIVNISPGISRNILQYQPNEIIFELYGRLAKVYLLKEGERVVDFSKDKLTIANGSSDKNALFRRLLRYDTLCKIKFPKQIAVEFEKLIKKSLENIDIIKDNIN